MSKKNIKKIYIVLSYSGTLLSYIIKSYTKEDYSHVSIALDKNLDRMYSFGRINPYNPFYGGFVQEGITFGTFRRFKNTKVEIYSLSLPINKYEAIENLVKTFTNNRTIYKFNIVGLFACAFNYKFRQYHAFYCAEFVKHLLEQANIDLNLPDVIKPMDFKIPEKMDLEYAGLLRKYSPRIT